MATPGELNKQLHDAVQGNDIVRATVLLDTGANINSRGRQNRTVLIEASHKGNKALVEILLCKGAAIDETDSLGNTALIEAAKEGHEEIVPLLLQKNADTEKKTRDGKMALMFAAWRGHQKTVDLLLQNNADTEKKDVYGWSAIHRAAMNNHPSIINRLVGCGATVDIVEYKGKTPLWLAASNGHVHCVNVLLNLGADPHFTSKSEGSPLDVAKENGHSEVVKRLNGAVKSHQHISSLSFNSAVAAVAPHLTRLHATQVARSSDIQKSAAQQLEAANVKELQCSYKDSDILPQSDQPPGVAPTGKDEALVRQLIEKNKQIEQKQVELDAAVREKSTMETEMLEMRQQLEALRQALNEERREKATITQQNPQLQLERNEKQKQKTMSSEQQVESSRQTVLQANSRPLYELEQRLAASTAANEELRQMLQQSEEVRNIASGDVHVTDQKLGKGSYGEVRIAYWQGCPVAVKMLHESLAGSKHNIQLFLQEVSIAWKIHHPNIAGVCGVTLELQEEKKTAWIVMELLQGSMGDVIEASQKEGPPLTLREQVDMAVDSACGLNYLHSLSRVVLHGDIRPTNILITTVMKAKLGDLGSARFSDATLSVGLVSPEYTAPERVDGRSPQKCKETDIYSMGVTLCELFTGLPPNPQARMNQIQRIRQKDVFLVSMRMVTRDPLQRPSAAEVHTAIGHIRQTNEYKKCSPKRMVKGKVDGVDNVTLTDHIW